MCVCIVVAPRKMTHIVVCPPLSLSKNLSFFGVCGVPSCRIGIQSCSTVGRPRRSRLPSAIQGYFDIYISMVFVVCSIHSWCVVCVCVNTWTNTGDLQRERERERLTERTNEPSRKARALACYSTDNNIAQHTASPCRLPPRQPPSYHRHHRGKYDWWIIN